ALAVEQGDWASGRCRYPGVAGARARVLHSIEIYLHSADHVATAGGYCEVCLELVRLEAPRRVRTRPMRHLSDLDMAGRRAAVAELGQPQFRADQLSRHYFGRLTEDPAQMTDLPAASRAELVKALLPGLLTAQREQQADQGTTVKTLWRAADGAYLESVLMRYPGRVTMCVSSQAGCGMACPFCATGQAGLTRNLS